MIGALLIVSAIATAALAAAAARLPSLVSTILTGYLALVADAVVLVVALSPFRAVTQGGLLRGQTVLLLLALGGWWLRGRPGIPFAAVRGPLRQLAGSPLTIVFVGVVVLVLGYELLLALSVPPNNWDSLNYHLSRAAGWLQYGGIHWIHNAPTDILNTRQPVAEEEVLFLFAATGSAALFALPQYVAELAILVAVYGSARRLGFGVCPAACGAALLASFSLVALEATTAQNDLVAASFAAVAACLIVGAGGSELALAGAAVGIGIGVKLTTALVWPVLLWLACLRGRKAVAIAAGGAIAGFTAVGMWGYVLNLVHTGRILGEGRLSIDVSSSPSYPGSVVTAQRVLYGMMDRSVLSNRLIDGLAVAGALAAAGAAAHTARRGRPRLAVPEAARVAIPFLAPLITIGAGGVIAYLARAWGHPVRGRTGDLGGLTHTANEDFSAFGPLGAVALLGVIALTVVSYARRRADLRHLALATALPSFLVLLAVEVQWNPFLTRFLLVPAVLAAPLLARLFRDRATTAAYLVVAAITVGLTITHVQAKPLTSPYGRPWDLSQVQALEVAGDPGVAAAVAALADLVPADACIGAVLGPSEPSYVLFGPRLQHHLVFLSVDHDTVLTAYRAGLFYVVISRGTNRYVADRFRSAGWVIRPLARYWLLASEPNAGEGSCRA